jgi:hypothetical protein
MHILALDMSKARTGWASWSDDQDRPTYGSFSLGSDMTDKWDVLVNLHKRWLELTAFGYPTHVVLEKPANTKHWDRPTNFDNDCLLIRITGQLGYLARVCNVRYIRETDGSKWFTQFNAQPRSAKRAKGVSTKDITLQTCRQAGLKPKNDDEADAIGILTYEMSNLGIEAPWMQWRTPLLLVGKAS